ncbi:MAG TPA: hypothetical protein DF698_00410 [Candidatus Atribacteria bacterium]|nr:hypothetical protein [Candidatus Atribacteria bacterium]
MLTVIWDCVKPSVIIIKKVPPVSAEESRVFLKRFKPWRYMVGYYLLMDHIENGKNYVTSI